MSIAYRGFPIKFVFFISYLHIFADFNTLFSFKIKKLINLWGKFKNS